MNGDDLLLFVHDGAIYRPIACITSNELSSVAETRETKTKCAPGVVGVEYSAINKSVSIEGESLDTGAGGDPAKASFDFLESLQDAKTKADIRLTTGVTGTTEKFATVVIQNLVQTAPAGDTVTFTATLNFDGGYGVDPHLP